MTWRNVCFTTMCVFGGGIYLSPWMAIPSILAGVMIILESHKLKVKVSVEGEVLARLVEVENTMRQLKTQSTLPTTPGHLKGFR